MTYEQELQVVKDLFDDTVLSEKILSALDGLPYQQAIKALSRAKELVNDLYEKKSKQIMSSEPFLFSEVDINKRKQGLQKTIDDWYVTN